VLALALGRTVREIEDGMTMRERMEWQRFDYYEPIGAVRADMRAAIIAASVVNALTGKPQRLEKYMPFLRSRSHEQSSSDQAREVISRATSGHRRFVVTGTRRRAPQEH